MTIKSTKSKKNKRMDIKQLMQQMHNASSEQEKKRIENEIKLQFSLLSDEEKKNAKSSLLLWKILAAWLTKRLLRLLKLRLA